VVHGREERRASSLSHGGDQGRWIAHHHHAEAHSVSASLEFLRVVQFETTRLLAGPLGEPEMTEDSSSSRSSSILVAKRAHQLQSLVATGLK
jgi:hypothetical protein